MPAAPIRCPDPFIADDRVSPDAAGDAGHDFRRCKGTPLNITLAIILQVISSLSFATGATLQALGVRSTFDASGTASSNQLSAQGMLRLFFIPKWLLGLLFVLVGAGIHLYALTIAPVTVVQPVGILAVPWSVLIASRIHGHHIPGRIWKGSRAAGVVEQLWIWWPECVFDFL